MLDIVLSILVLAAVGLLVGAYFLWRRGGSMKQVSLMALLAVIALINVAIWTVPDAEGTSPLDKVTPPEDLAD